MSSFVLIGEKLKEYAILIKFDVVSKVYKVYQLHYWYVDTTDRVWITYILSIEDIVTKRTWDIVNFPWILHIDSVHHNDIKNVTSSHHW